MTSARVLELLTAALGDRVVTSADALSALDPSLPVTPEDNRRRWAAIEESFEATRTEVSPPLQDALGGAVSMAARLGAGGPPHG